MKKSIWSAVFTVFTLVFSSGCSSSYPITYNTNPKGATLICDGNSYGYTPVTLYYELNKTEIESGIGITEKCTAKWFSGAEETYPQELDLKKFPNGAQVTLNRPNTEGYEKDAEFALKVEMLNAQQQQAAAAAKAQAWWSINQSIQNMNQNFQMQQQNFQLQQLNNNLMYRRYY